MQVKEPVASPLELDRDALLPDDDVDLPERLGLKGLDLAVLIDNEAKGRELARPCPTGRNQTGKKRETRAGLTETDHS